MLWCYKSKSLLKNEHSLLKGNTEDTELVEIHQTVAEEQTEKDNVRSDEEKLEVNWNKKEKYILQLHGQNSAQDLNQTDAENEEETMEEKQVDWIPSDFFHSIIKINSLEW